MRKILLHKDHSFIFLLNLGHFRSMAAAFFEPFGAQFDVWKQHPPELFDAISSPRQFTVCLLLCDTAMIRLYKKADLLTCSRSAFLFEMVSICF